MRYSGSIFISTNNKTIERFTDEENIYNYFKELFGKKRSRVIEESFSAPDILNRLNSSFKSSGITNLVRITHDDVDFFMDTESRTDDMQDTIERFKRTLKSSFERFYEEIAVVLETSQYEIDFVIELQLLRVHQIGEYPIQINFSGIPINTEVKDVEKKFKLLVSKVEQNILKFMNINDITISITKKLEQNILEETETGNTEKDDIGEYDEKLEYEKIECSFFPLYGVTLGITTVKELANKGVRAKDYDTSGEPYKYYLINSMNFWYDNNRASHMYLTYSYALPDKWRKCGFDWSLSYNNWIKLFESLGFNIAHVTLPKKEWYSGKRTLVAEFKASKKISRNLQLVFEMHFNYSQKTSVNSKGTVYSMNIWGR